MILTTLKHITEAAGRGLTAELQRKCLDRQRGWKAVAKCPTNIYAVLDIEEPLYKPKTQGSHNRSVPRNNFAVSSMRKIGGGEVRLLNNVLPKFRRGGDELDNYQTLASCAQTRDLNKSLPLDCKKFAKFLCKGVEVDKLCVTELTMQYKLKTNLGANPGPTFKYMGFNNKAGSFPVAFELANELFHKAKEGPIVGQSKPVYSFAGRSKLVDINKYDEKSLHFKKVGRSVWMADSHEPILASTVTYPLMRCLHKSMHVVANGFNKYSDDPARFCEKFSHNNTFVNGDFSGFDDSLPVSLIRQAIGVIYYCYSFNSDNDMLQVRHILDWLEDELTSTRVVLPTGEFCRVTGGLPSGSGMTALVGSICNAIIWYQFLSREGIPLNYIVQGDDVLLGLTHWGNRRRYARGVLLRAEKFFNMHYGITLNPDKCNIGLHMFVDYIQPKVPEFIKDGSSTVLAAYRQVQKLESDRDLSFEDRFDYLLEEPITGAPGLTHRWSYLFKDRMKFLSLYFKKGLDDKVYTLRPLIDSVEKLVHPPTRVRNIDDHIGRLQACLLDNVNNQHVVNHVMHYAYDAYLLKRGGVFTFNDLKHVSNKLNRRRAWYRRVDRTVDLLSVDRGFSRFWDGFQKAVEQMRSLVFGKAEMDWGEYRDFADGKYGIRIGAACRTRVGECAQYIPNLFYLAWQDEIGYSLTFNPKKRVLYKDRAKALLDGSSKEERARIQLACQEERDIAESLFPIIPDTLMARAYQRW